MPWREPSEVSAPRPDAQPWRDINDGSPSIAPERIRDTTVHVSAFGDDQWSLNPLGRTAGQGDINLHFAQPTALRVTVAAPPHVFRDTAKRIAYLFINEPMPRSYTQRHRSSARETLAPNSIQAQMRTLAAFFAWLEEQGCHALRDCTEGLLNEYRLHVDALAVGDDRKFVLLSAVEKVAHLGPLLPEDDRLDFPPWEAKTIFRFGKAAAGSRRDVLAPEVADPLIAFVVACVRNLGPDIIAGYDCAMAMLDANTDPQGTWAEAVALLQGMAEGDGIPARVGDGGRVFLAASYLGATHGFTPKMLSAVVHRKGLQPYLNVSLPTSIPVPVHGRIGGVPWCDGVPWEGIAMGNAATESPALLRHLQTACWVLIATLSGARPEEVRRLPIDTLQVVPPREPGGAVRYVLHGSLRKGVTDDEGRASLEGEARRWVTIGPGADAVRLAAEVARRVDPATDYLFPSPQSKAIGHSTLADRVGDMVRWANSLIEQLGLPDAYRIKSDRSGSWDLSGFRRTLAWHVHSQSGGEVALALQFQHADTVLGGDGYSSVADIGLRQVMGEAARAAHEATLSEVGTMLLNGTHISGPAAERLVEAAALLHPVLATYATDREVSAVLDAPGMQVYDNPDAYSLCVYVPHLAKCLTESEVGSASNGGQVRSMPDRGACQDSCACHARTDLQIDVLREEAAQHRREAASPLTPEPLRHRLLQVAERKDARVAEHESRAVFIRLEDVLTVRLDDEGGLSGSA